MIQRKRNTNLVAASHGTQAAIARLTIRIPAPASTGVAVSPIATAVAAFATAVEERLASFFLGSIFSSASRRSGGRCTGSWRAELLHHHSLLKKESIGPVGGGVQFI